MKKLITLSAMAALGGCASFLPQAMNSAVDSWLGAPISEATQQWGPPSERFAFHGGERYQWRTFGCIRELQAHNDVVVAAQWRGDNCCVATIAGRCGNMPRKQQIAIPGKPLNTD